MHIVFRGSTHFCKRHISPPRYLPQPQKNVFVKQLDEQTLHIRNQHIFQSRVVKESFLLQFVPG